MKNNTINFKFLLVSVILVCLASSQTAQALTYDQIVAGQTGGLAPSSSSGVYTGKVLGAATPVSFIQSAAGSNNFGGSQTSTAFNSANTSGDTIVVLIQWMMESGTDNVSSVIDSRGNNYTVIAGSLKSVGPTTHYANIYTQIAYATNIAAGANTVTVNWNQGVDNGFASIFEISPSIFDQTTAGTGTSGSPSAGSIVTSANGAFAAATTYEDDGFGGGSVFSSGNGWTVFQNTGGGAADQGSEYQSQATAGSISGSFSAGSGTWVASMATFVPSGTSSSDTTAPSTPTNLSATAVSSSAINLSWAVSTDNVGVTGYKVYRGGTQIATSATNSYSDTGLTASTQYTYTVSAYDAAGNNSSQSTSVSATTQTQGVGASGNIYIAQVAAGSNNGSSCANAYAYSFFNTPSNWGSDSGQIGPGVTVHICGTITDSLNGVLLTAQGSGAQGNPITIKFEPGAVLQSPGESYFIDGGNQSYFVIDGGTACGWINGIRVACNGIIRNTLDGFSGQTCIGGPCSNQIQTTAISDINADWEIRNLEIGPIYIHGGTSDETFTSPGPRCISFTNGGGNYNFHNLIMHDAAWCMNGGGNNINVSNVEEYRVDHGFGMGQYTDTPTTISGITIHDNYIHDMAVWDQNSNAFHHDGIHLFSYCGTNLNGNNTFCPQTIIKNINIYNNRFGGDWGGHTTGNIFFEGNIQNANIFNNVTVVYSSVGGQLSNGFWNGWGSNVNVFNNTILGPGSAAETYKLGGIIPGPGIIYKNNIITDAAMISVGGLTFNPCPYTAPGGQGTVACASGTYSLGNNAYLAPTGFGNGFGSCPSGNGASSLCNGFWNFTQDGFNSFEAQTGETGAIFDDTIEPNGTYFTTVAGAQLTSTTGSEISGSPTINAGVNLTSLCASLGISGSPCLYDINGNPRPASGTWDIGAFQYSSGSGGTTDTTPPAPPTGVSVN